MAVRGPTRLTCLVFCGLAFILGWPLFALFPAASPAATTPLLIGQILAYAAIAIALWARHGPGLPGELDPREGLPEAPG